MAFGRLERTKGAEPMSDINVTPLVDVMLVLVVIFILTAPLLASSIRLQLPRAEGAQGGTPEHAVSLAVDAAGQVYLDEAPVDAATLAQRLRQIANQRPDTEVQLRADRSVPALCFRVAEPERPLSVLVRRHEIADALKLRVTGGQLITLFSPDGAAATSAERTFDVSSHVVDPSGSRWVSRMWSFGRREATTSRSSAR